MTDLLPCPFCKETSKEIIQIWQTEFLGSLLWQAKCLACGASSCFAETMPLAIEAWNTRAHPPKSVEGLVDRIPHEIPMPKNQVSLEDFVSAWGNHSQTGRLWAKIRHQAYTCGVENGTRKAFKEHAGEK